MLHPKTRIIFKAPVAHVHNIIGKLLLPWGMTYVIFLPYIYMTLSGIEGSYYVYTITTLLTNIIFLATFARTVYAYLQQPINGRALLLITIWIPLSLTLWYAVTRHDWLLNVFTYCFLAEIVLFVIYYIKSYNDFVRDIKDNYSNISNKMFHSIWIQWGCGILTFMFYYLAAIYDTVLLNIINIVTNLFAIFLYVYTSEHMMPLPDKEEIVIDEKNKKVEYEKNEDMEAALKMGCENTLLFRNPELSLNDLALAVGTNRTYMSRWFTSNNTSFYTYINNLRIEYAGKLLRTTDTPVTQIQLDSGFTSKTTFRKYFHERFDCSPTEYRKKQGV